MPRLPRFFVPDLPLHVIQRGNDRAPIFGGPDDLTFFRDCLWRTSRKYGVAIFEGAVLYTSEEPCIMCCGAVRSAGLRTFVYGTTGAQAKRISGRPLPDRLLECREVYARLEYPIAIRGPLLEKEGLALLVEHHERRTAVK